VFINHFPDNSHLQQNRDEHQPQLHEEDGMNTPRKEMGAKLHPGGTFVLLHHVHNVEMQKPMERVNCNQNVPGVLFWVITSHN
jgi:hypothetical protein